MGRLLQSLAVAFCTFLPLLGTAATLNITNGIQTYTSLANTTVNLTNRCELHITAASNPIGGCVINLNSSNGWFFLDSIPPATVASTYLSQVTVSGTPAVADSNVRVVEFGMGAVVIPHAPSILPLTVFSGTQFAGSSMQLGLYTYYNNANLGGMYRNIASFKLKRGYTAAFAQSPAGTGNSRVYVAQDGDLEVGVLPSDLTASVGFVRVFPWRWTSKKGWAGGADTNAVKVAPRWSYDWDNSTTSSRNIEYVPMRHDANWNAYANINNKQDSTHALGFNEPDSSSQANMTVDQAIAQWPNLMASGLRLGSPATTDGGLSWLYSFIAKADSLHYRVDYVAVHFYRCGYSATDLYNFLLAIHNQTGRPVWVTEFNNGATWTTCSVPTLAQNATTIQSFISMLDSTPFVERYSIYNWVGDTRAMVDTNGVLTPAGTNYLNENSPNGFVQDYPGAIGSEANYLFDGDGRDRTGGGNNALLAGAPSFATGQSGQAIQLDGIHDYAQLPANVGSGSNFTFAAWVKWNGGGSWQRILDLGADTMRYLFLTPSSGSGTLRFAITTNGNSAEQRLDSSPLTAGVWTHVAVTIGGSTGQLFVNGAPVATNNSMTFNPSTVAPKYSYLGRSQFSADPLFAGQMDSVFFAGYALSAAQVAALPTNVPPQFTSDPIAKPAINFNQYYFDSLATNATNAGGGALTFSKVDGPAWLSVASDGGLGGSPSVNDLGTNIYTVRVVNSGGAAAFARLVIPVQSPINQPGNFGFETPATSTYIYNPGGASWTFSQGSGTGSGVSANGSGFTAGNATAPEGLQVAFLQATGTMSQTLTGLTPGTHYTVQFLASQRQNKSGGQAGETFDVRIDGTTIGSFAPDQGLATYTQYSATFTATGATHTLSFVGTDLNGGDNTVFLDKVLLSAPPPNAPQPPTSLAAQAGNALVNLSWAQSTNPGIMQNKVYRSSSGSGGLYSLLATLSATNAFADTSVINGGTYYYVATAISTNGESAFSGYAGAMPQGPTTAIQPFTPDVATLHLYHFNELATPVVDYAPGGTNLTYMIGGATLGNPSYANGNGDFTNCISFGTLATTNAVIFPIGSAFVGTPVPFTYAGANGAFTFEAMVHVEFNPTNFVRTQPCQIMNCDANNTGGGSRVFQFRLDPVNFIGGGGNTNVVRIEFINGTATVAMVPVPTNGPDAIVSNAWYHVAVTYNGVPNTISNLLFYWTLLDTNRTIADCIYGTNMASGLPGTSTATTIFSVGNSARNPAGGTAGALANFLGKIDEVRISSVARSPTNMLFVSAGITILSQPTPTNQLIAAGQPFNLSVTAISQLPLGYQWRQNGQPLANATNSTYSIISAQASDAGSYDVMITNRFDTLFSDTASVAVTNLMIVTQPVSVVAPYGGTATFNVLAAGAQPLFYQWRKNGGQLASATNASLTLSAVGPGDVANYDAVVSNSLASVTSSVASLTLAGAQAVLTPVSDGTPGSSGYAYAGSSAINGVSFICSSLVTVSNQQFLAYYGRHQTNASYVYNNTIWIARRALGATLWEIFRTTLTANDITDGHDVVVFGIDGAGYMHLSWGMHDAALHYARSTTPVTGSQPISIGPDLGTMTGTETSVTYPQFLSLPNGDLLFLYRVGASGGGDTWLNRWSLASQTWTNVNVSGGIPVRFIQGLWPSASYNAYPDMPCLDAAGNFYLVWTWRETPAYQSNHDLNFAKSTDGGVTWQRSDGTPYDLPISENGENGDPNGMAEVIVPIPQNSSLINQAGMCLDAANNPIVATWWAPGTPTNNYRRQYMVAFPDTNGVWQTRQVSNRTNDPPGTMMQDSAVRDLGRPVAVCDKQNRVIVLYRDNFLSNGLTVVYSLPYLVDPQRTNWTTLDLTTDNLGNYEPVIDLARWQSDNVLDIVYQPSSGEGYTPPTNTASPIGILEWNAASYFNYRPTLQLTLVNSNQDALLSWISQPGWGYQVQWSTDLTAWNTVATLNAPAGFSSMQYTHTNGGLGPQRFWRLLIKEGGF